MSKIYSTPPGWHGTLMYNDFYRHIRGKRAELFEYEPDIWACKFVDMYKNNMSYEYAHTLVEFWINISTGVENFILKELVNELNKDPYTFEVYTYV